MTLEGAINFHETDSFTIYTMNSASIGQYCVVFPKNGDTYHMLVDLHKKSLFDAVSNGSKTKQELIDDVSLEYTNIKSKYTSGILVLPMFSEELLKGAINSGDKQKMFDETKKIGAITSELYKKLTDAGVEKQKINQKIMIVEKTEEDRKYIEWLKEQMPNFVEGLDYSEFLPKQETLNPFMSESPFEMNNAVPENIAPSKPEPAPSNSIFDRVPPTVEPTMPTPSIDETPTKTEENAVNSVTNNVGGDLFSSASSSVSTETGSKDTTDLFGTPDTATPKVEVSQPVMTNVESPKPVQNVELEGTTTFQAIPEEQSKIEEAPNAENDDVTDGRNGSKGFANLLILAVILIGVTIASIELGKFLYSVYGTGV